MFVDLTGLIAYFGKTIATSQQLFGKNLYDCEKNK
jgi:hypothetical protein